MGNQVTPIPWPRTHLQQAYRIQLNHSPGTSVADAAGSNLWSATQRPGIGLNIDHRSLGSGVLTNIKQLINCMAIIQLHLELVANNLTSLTRDDLRRYVQLYVD